MTTKLLRKPNSIEPHVFSQAFEQMCSVVAIADTESASDTLKQLILHCCLLCPREGFYDSQQIKECIGSLFGLQVPQHEIDMVFSKMIEDGCIVRPNGTNFVLPDAVRVELQKRIDEANTLENGIKAAWRDEVTATHPSLDFTCIWNALRDYLARAFARHGILTAALLNPSVDTRAEQMQSLASLLNDVVGQGFSGEDRVEARAAISDFLDSVVDHTDRATYIAQLANGAFNYYSLAVAPDISARMLANLNDLTLFLDTNFLLGILDLHEHHLVAISHQLLTDIATHKLPFKLRFHPITQEELRSTLSFYGKKLRQRTWSPSLSSLALAQISTLSGIERRYHQMNIERKIDVNSFLSRYDHVDEILKDQSIEIYRLRTGQETDISKLVYDYSEYLKKRKPQERRDKSEGTIKHDMTLLAFVRQQRTNVKSSLEAGALLLTCDSVLCKFDLIDSHRHHTKVCTILPDVLWQILRPFLLSSSHLDRESFDRAFAATFAVPEFRTIENSGPREKAREKMLYMLAKFEGITEATASRLLSNDILLDKLRTDMSDEDFQQQLQSIALQDNAVLLEDKAALEREIERQQQENESMQTQLARMQEAHETALIEERERSRQAITIAQQVANEERINTHNAQEQAAMLREQSSKDRETSDIAQQESERRIAAIEARLQASEEKREREKVEYKARLEHYRKVVVAFALSIVLSACIILLVQFVPFTPFITIRLHPHSAGLKVAAIMLTFCIVFMIAVPRWSRWLASVCLVGVLLGVLQII